MVRLTDLVRAPPERVWDRLVHPKTRTADSRAADLASLESGQAGQEGAIVRYERKGKGWREVVVAAEPPKLLEAELRETNDRMTAKLEWTLRPVDVGSVVILEVRGRSIADKFVHRYLRRWRYRRWLSTLKLAVEGPPASMVDRIRPSIPTEGEAPSQAPPAPTPETPPPAPPEPEPSRSKSAKKPATKGSKKRSVR